MVYPEAWKSSPRVAAMAPAARSGYWEILLSMWLAGGELPDDDAMLMACARLTSSQWKAHRAVIRAMLTVVDGKVTQDRLAEEYQRTVELVQKRKEAADKRWENERSKQKQKPPKTDARAVQVHHQNGGFARETETETETGCNTHSDECALQGAYDPEPGLRRFEREAKRLAPDRWVMHPAESAWCEVVNSAERERQVFDGLDVWLESKQWSDGVFHRWDRWLREVKFLEVPRRAVSSETSPSGADIARKLEVMPR